MLPARLSLCAALLLATAIAPTTAFAAEPTQADREAARVKGEEGLKLFGAEKYAEALEKFEAAYQAVPAPSLKLYRARCLRKIGKLVEARNLYEQIVLEALPKDAPSAYVQAQTEAKSELDALRKRIPILQIVTSGVPPESIRAAVDGRSAPIRDERIELNPGDHVVDVISTRAKLPERRSITLTEGSAERLSFVLVPVSGAMPIEEPTPLPASSPKTKDESGSIIPGLFVLGMGAVNVGVGGVLGILSMNKVEDIRSRCAQNVCKPEDEPAADAARVMGNVATVNLAVGAVGLAAGTTLLLFRGGIPQKMGSRGNGIQSFDVAIGPGSIGFTGTFQ